MVEISGARLVDETNVLMRGSSRLDEIAKTINIKKNVIGLVFMNMNETNNVTIKA
jgi:hypothetical protein